MKQLILFFWEICLLKKGPQDLPTSRFLLNITMALYFFTGVLYGVYNKAFLISLAQVTMDIFIFIVFLKMILSLSNYSSRFIQTVTAIFGISAVFTMLGLPLMYLRDTLLNDALLLLVSYLFLAIIIWNIVVIGHIFRHALSITLFVGVLMGLLYVFIANSIMAFMIPQQVVSL